MRAAFVVACVSVLAISGEDSQADRLPSRPLSAGDITVTASATENVVCDSCEAGMGTRICYEVSLGPAAISGLMDFHVVTNDPMSKHFQCPSPAGWGFALNSFVKEGSVSKHYVSWYTNDNGNTVPANGHETFCFVYCGNGARDNTLEWIATNTGAQVPGAPDAQGNRADVPDLPTDPFPDDPGWKSPFGGTPVTNGAGFAAYDPDFLPVLSLPGVLATGSLLSALGLLTLRRRKR